MVASRFLEVTDEEINCLTKMHKIIIYVIKLFTVVFFVTWPLNESEAGVDLVMIQASLLFLCKFLHKNIINIRKGGRSVS